MYETDYRYPSLERDFCQKRQRLLLMTSVLSEHLSFWFRQHPAVEKSKNLGPEIEISLASEVDISCQFKMQRRVVILRGPSKSL